MRFNGDRLEQLRRARNWDQHRLAEAARASGFGVGITQSQISRYENGQEPSGRNALALAAALGVDVRELYVADESSASADSDEEVAALSLDDYLRVRIRQIMAEERAAAATL